MTKPMPVKLSRGDFPAGAVLCDHCTAKCCRYYSLQIDEPKTATDRDYVRWFLLHQRATIFIDSGIWYLKVESECKHLQPDNRCGIYDTRPQICREYSQNDCEFDDDWLYEYYFETAEQLEEYWEVTAPPRNATSIRSPRPPVVPVIG